ncbi:MAG: Antidote-toxin recognition MazE, bacterial antitoxin [Deltaproteobacteria bacterium]|nr:Antidote-toxin recognition MazE, bacterial antitoxin [Deltaproteobacteria bacterium]
MKAVVTLSSKNQIAIPKAARKKLSIGPGDQLILDVEKDSLDCTGPSGAEWMPSST